MKKIYVKPSTNLVDVNIENLLVQCSNTEAGSGAVSLSRGNNGASWDDEE